MHSPVIWIRNIHLCLWGNCKRGNMSERLCVATLIIIALLYCYRLNPYSCVYLLQPISILLLWTLSPGYLTRLQLPKCLNCIRSCAVNILHSLHKPLLKKFVLSQLCGHSFSVEEKQPLIRFNHNMKWYFWLKKNKKIYFMTIVILY